MSKWIAAECGGPMFWVLEDLLSLGTHRLGSLKRAVQVFDMEVQVHGGPMALELAPKVRVCAVAPGYVLTPMQRAEYSDAMLEEVNRKVPLGRHAAPEEIAALFAYLASDDAAYATGQVFTLDGGETAGGLASR